MLEYAKVILPKVCFWKDLFKKELQKCIRRSSFDELNALNIWCYENFYDMYPDILKEVFADSNIKRKERKLIIPSNLHHTKQKKDKHRRLYDLPVS